MANIARDIFKAYDIRGIVGKTLTDEAAYLIGKAIATKAAEKSITRIALGRDRRGGGDQTARHNRQQRPQLHEVVLHWGARDGEFYLRV